MQSFVVGSYDIGSLVSSHHARRQCEWAGTRGSLMAPVTIYTPRTLLAEDR